MLQVDSVYAQPGGVPLQYDLVRPRTDEAVPLIVCIHGGGWISGERTDLAEIAQVFAARGLAAASVEYRLAPLHHFPAAVEDVQAFVRFARGHAKELGIDPTRIGAFGSSAGGHLAAMLAVTDEGGSRVNAAVCLCPITDVTSPAERHFPISWSFLEQFMGVPYGGAEDRYRSASPVAHVDNQAAPLLLFHGDADDIVPLTQSELLASAYAAHRARCTLRPVPGEAHGFSMEAWPEVERLTLEFFAKELG